MSAISTEVLDAIKGAVQLEIDGKAFFDHAAEQTAHQLGKKMFQKLARDEVQHLKTFGELFTTVIGNEEWKKFVSEKEKSKSPLIEELKARMVKKEQEERAGETEAIRIGMELERKAIDFFTNAAQKSGAPKAKDIFLKIADEERLHYDLLQAQYDSVANSGFWFDVAEFKMDGKYS
jgi:rubrerythrin